MLQLDTAARALALAADTRPPFAPHGSPTGAAVTVRPSDSAGRRRPIQLHRYSIPVAIREIPARQSS